MDLTKLTITDLFLYKEMIEAMIDASEDNENVTEEGMERLYQKLDKLDNEVYSRIDKI